MWTLKEPQFESVMDNYDFRLTWSTYSKQREHQSYFSLYEVPVDKLKKYDCTKSRNNNELVMLVTWANKKLCCQTGGVT